jgi:hypothetical protein
MSCYTTSDMLNNPPRNHPCITLTGACRAWTSVEEDGKDFLATRSINDLTIFKHHIWLRARGKLPILTSNGGGRSGESATNAISNFLISFVASHLCDTVGCLRDEHLVVESMQINQDRRLCNGIILVLQSNGPSTPKEVLQVQPCVHGANHRQTRGNFLRYSCRKIQVIIQDAACRNYFNTLSWMFVS